MDLGAGTGLLSLWASKFGAKSVYAFEPSSFSAITQAIFS
jgi:predicted RNA methylase